MSFPAGHTLERPAPVVSIAYRTESRACSAISSRRLQRRGPCQRARRAQDGRRRTRTAPHGRRQQRPRQQARRGRRARSQGQPVVVRRTWRAIASGLTDRRRYRRRPPRTHLAHGAAGNVSIISARRVWPAPFWPNNVRLAIGRLRDGGAGCVTAAHVLGGGPARALRHAVRLRVSRCRSGHRRRPGRPCAEALSARRCGGRRPLVRGEQRGVRALWARCGRGM